MAFCDTLYYSFWICILKRALATEITEISYYSDNSLNFTIYLPVFRCHAKDLNYDEVLWYKDDFLVKRGGSSPADHVLNVKTLLDRTSFEFQHPLKLQGYYWCETDSLGYTTWHKHLFRIQQVHTYVGKLLATHDSIAADEVLSVYGEIFRKKKTLEKEMTEKLFSFLPEPNTYVTQLQDTSHGLSVQFYLYTRPTYIRAQPLESEIEDHHELEYIALCLLNGSFVDNNSFDIMLNWVELKGIRMNDLQIRSTFACYEENVVTEKSTVILKWPYAKIGEIVLPESIDSSKKGLSMTRTCTGDFRSGAEWGTPYGEYDRRDNSLTSRLKSLLNAFGKVKIHRYVERLERLVSPKNLEVIDIHIVIKIMEKLSLLTDLEEEEIYTIFSVISNLVESDKDKLLESMNRIQVAKRVLEIIKNVIKSATENNAEVQFSSKNFMIETKELTPSEDENPIVGAAVSRTTNDEISVEFLSANTTPSKSECIAYFLLPIDFVKDRERQKIFGDKITFGYFRDWLLFSNPNPEKSLDMRNYEVLSTPVVFASMSEGPAGNLGHPVQLYFKDMVRATTEMPICVYYDPYLEDINGFWSAEGCEFAGLTDEFYSCRCHHLSVFSIYLAHYPVVTSNTKPTFSIIVYVGGAISFLILSFAVVLFTISKMFRETHDHFVLLNVALSFLISVGLITFSDLLHSLCRVLSLLLLYTIFVTMQWLISYAILFKMKFTKKRCVSEMPSWKNLIKWSIIPLVLPIFIVYLIWPTKYYDPFKGSCLSLLTAVSQTSMIALSFDMFFSLCMYASAAHSWYKKAKVFMDAETEELARKFRIIFAVNVLYFLSWLCAFFALQTRSRTLTTFFAFYVALTSCAIAYLFVIEKFSLSDFYQKSKKKILRKETVKYTKSFECADDEGFVEMYI